ncbi:MAG TPA: polysaccharide biosynthesis/export family protein [Luteolibacter sp.]|nr:polysaccharide biosynthesis/export family protein [Luteolibacter sp.]
MKAIPSHLKTLLAIFTVTLCLFGHAFGQIQVGKAITVEIRGVPPEEQGRINGAYFVGDNGTINMPYVGAIRAAGLKPEALAATLEARYRAAEIYRNPSFQVVGDEEGAKLDQNVVHIGGQVVRSGPVPFQRGLTLWQAIQAAGGPTPFGTLQRVKVLRDGKQRQYDVTQVEAMQVQLQPNDAIEVPQKRPWEVR